jgi:type II secretory pathway component PulF
MKINKEKSLMIPGTFMTISGDDIATTTSYVADFLDDFEPVLLVVVGVGIALIVVGVLVSVFKK